MLLVVDQLIVRFMLCFNQCAIPLIFHYGLDNII